MELTERKKKVLRSIVDLYIRTAEPVGSKAIAELPDMNYSPATIRNEMADLLAMGYLEQPHTSAGRVPSAAGYRLYVDELMADYRLSMDETKSINAAMENKMQRFDQMMDQVAKLVSQATQLPAISLTSRQAGSTVKRFDLIMAGADSVILVLMLSGDEVVNKLIRLPVAAEEGDLKVLSAVLNATMTGISAEEITPEVLERVMNAAGAAASLVPVVVEFTVDKGSHTEDAVHAAFPDQIHKCRQILFPFEIKYAFFFLMISPHHIHSNGIKSCCLHLQDPILPKSAGNPAVAQITAIDKYGLTVDQHIVPLHFNTSLIYFHKQNLFRRFVAQCR